MLIAIDCGKYQTRAITEDKSLIFRTKLSENVEKMYTGKTFEIEFQSKKYILGDDAAQSDYDITKAKLIHKIAIYTSVAMLCDTSVKLAIGCPLSHFRNKDLKEEYKNYIYDDGLIEIKVNGKNKLIEIEDVMVFPESCGVVYNNMLAYLNRLVGVIDIGGLNTNAAIYDRLKPVQSSTITINEGGNILMAKLKRELNVQLGCNIQDYQVPYLIKDDKNKNITDAILRQQVELIIEELKKYNWDLANLPLIFTGGGSLLLSQYIKELLPDARISENPVWDNVKGFYVMGDKLCKVK